MACGPWRASTVAADLCAIALVPEQVTRLTHRVFPPLPFPDFRFALSLARHVVHYLFSASSTATLLALLECCTFRLCHGAVCPDASARFLVGKAPVAAPPG
jgi:hypothetical protein